MTGLHTSFNSLPLSLSDYPQSRDMDEKQTPLAAGQIDLHDFIDPNDLDFKNNVQINAQSIKPVMDNVVSFCKKIGNERPSPAGMSFAWFGVNGNITDIHFASSINLAELKAAYIGSFIRLESGKSNDLYDLSDTCLRVIKESIKVNDLDCLTHIQKSMPCFVEKLIKTPDQILKNISLLEIQTGCLWLKADGEGFRNSSLWFALAEKKRFLKREVKDLVEDSLNFVPLVASRLDLLANELQVERNSPLLTLGKLRTLSANEIYALPASLPACCFKLLSIEQMKGLDFNQLSIEKINAVIEGPGGEDSMKMRIRELNGKQRQIACEKACYDIKKLINK